MKFKFSLLIILVFVVGACKPVATIGLSNSIIGKYKSYTMIATTKYYNIKLIQDKDTTSSLYEPVFENRKILINDTLIVNINDLCGKSILYNSSFSFFKNCLKVRKVKKELLKIEVLLGQDGCSGSFCSDMILVKIIVNHGKLSAKFEDIR